MNDMPTCDEHGTENTLAEGCHFCREAEPKTQKTGGSYWMLTK